MSILIDQVMKLILDKATKNETLSKAGREVTNAVWEWIRPIFLKDDEPLQDLLDNPSDKDNQVEVETKIRKHLKKHPEEEVELEKILTHYIDQSKSNIKFISQTHYGGGDNIAGDKIAGDKIGD